MVSFQMLVLFDIDIFQLNAIKQWKESIIVKIEFINNNYYYIHRSIIENGVTQYKSTINASFVHYYDLQ